MFVIFAKRLGYTLDKKDTVQYVTRCIVQIYVKSEEIHKTWKLGESMP